jgi:UDP-glucose 4-epimerase
VSDAENPETLGRRKKAATAVPVEAGERSSPGSKKAHRERVVVTGAAGGLGRLVCRRLHRSFDVIGVDARPFPDRPKDVEHHEADLRRKQAAQMLKRRRPECIVQLGVVQPASGAGSSTFHIETMNALLRLVDQVKARKLIFLSSATLYGASSTSGGFLTEESPLLGAGKTPELSSLISLDMMVQSFFWKHPETETVILRPVHMVGPHLRNPPTMYLRGKTIPTLMGFDPMVQLVHELDVVEAIQLAMQKGVRGIFNIVGGGQAPLSRLIEARGARSLPVPGPLLKAVVERASSWHLLSIPPTHLDHLRYSCLVDGRRAREELGYEAKHSLTQTLADLD